MFSGFLWWLVARRETGCTVRRPLPFGDTMFWEQFFRQELVLLHIFIVSIVVFAVTEWCAERRNR